MDHNIAKELMKINNSLGTIQSDVKTCYIKISDETIIRTREHKALKSQVDKIQRNTDKWMWKASGFAFCASVVVTLLSMLF